MFEIAGPFCKVSFHTLNLNSQKQVKDYLLSQGWVPTSFTEKGSPKITEDSYASIKGEMGQKLALRAVLSHRAKMLFNVDGEKGLINLVRSDGRIEAGAMTNATNTGRMKHRGVVNIPKPKDGKKYGLPFELRELFIIPEGKVMIGCDADGLEARMEAHSCLPYTGGKEYADDLINGDVHSKTAWKNGWISDDDYEFFYKHKVLKEPITDEERYKRIEAVRDFWKSPKYAITYGAQPQKLAETLGISLKESKKIFNGFWKGNTALKELKDAVTESWKKRNGFIKGVDGRKIRIRSSHSIVNALFQSTGSIVVKMAAILADEQFKQQGIDAQQVIIYHDELEIECKPEDAEKVCYILSDSFLKAGEKLNIRVPVTGSPTIGKNWMEVH